MTELAYLGPKGTYSHEAARAFCTTCIEAKDASLVECNTISEVFDLVDRGQVALGVVPIENSLEGSVNETLDNFSFNSGSLIAAENIIDIHHNLICAPNVELHEIKTVASHPQALGQCRRWLVSNLPTAKTLTTSSTADAVQLAINDPSLAAIGTQLAADIFGAQIKAQNIEDRFGNQTRFVLISSSALPHPTDTCGFKTSLALFMKEDRPGTLKMILEEFAFAKINLTKIQSRPTKRALGDYMFWIDFEGHTADIDVKTAIDCLRLKLRDVKSLGSYPAAATREQ